jgi:hypothetical protein
VGRDERADVASSAGLPMKSATSIVKKSLGAMKRSTVFSPMWSASTKYGPLPARAPRRRRRPRRARSRLAVDDQVLAVGLVPHRRHVDAELLRLHERRELRPALVGEAVADAPCCYVYLGRREMRRRAGN